LLLLLRLSPVDDERDGCWWVVPGGGRDRIRYDPVPAAAAAAAIDDDDDASLSQTANSPIVNVTMAVTINDDIFWRLNEETTNEENRKEKRHTEETHTHARQTPETRAQI
jgi:hypothetical protein